MKKFINLLSLLILISAMTPSHAMLLRSKINTAQLSKTALVKQTKKFKNSHKKYSNNSKKKHQSFNDAKENFKNINNDYKFFSLARVISFGGLVSALYEWWNGKEKKEEKNDKIFSTESLEGVPSYIHLVSIYEDPSPVSTIKKVLRDPETLKTRFNFSCDEEYLRHIINFILTNLYKENDNNKKTHIVNTIVSAVYEEKKKFSKNNIVLYHGISGANYILLDIYKRLYEELTKTKYTNNFLFLRFHNSCNHLSNDWQTDFLDQELEKHENNTPDLPFDQTDVKQYLLSTNIFVMGNLDEWQCSSFVFSMASFNLFFRSNEEKQIFNILQKSLNTQVEIQKYFKEIQQKSLKHGVLFQIAVKNDDFIYISAPGGNPIKNLTVKEFHKQIKNFASFQLDMSQARIVLDKDVVEKPGHYIQSIEKYYPNPDAHAYYNSKEYIQMREDVVQQILNAMTPLEQRMMEKDTRLELQQAGFSL